jgi:hypothetical protein
LPGAFPAGVVNNPCGFAAYDCFAGLSLVGVEKSFLGGSSNNPKFGS